jgi:hypothetical protein
MAFQPFGRDFQNALAGLGQSMAYRQDLQRQAGQDAQTSQRNALLMKMDEMRLAEAQQQQQQQGAVRNSLAELFKRQQTGGPVPGGDYQPVQFADPNPTRQDIFSALGRAGAYDAAVKFLPEEPKTPEPFTLSEGQTRFGAGGVPIASVAKPEKPGKQVERTVDLGNKVEYIYTDGTRELKPKAASPNAIVMGNAKTPKMEMDMRKEFTSLPEVKSHVEISSQIQRLEKAMAENARGGSKVAVDQALITILNKMLDPSSVVRESEYARTPGDLAFLNRMRGKLEKLKTGGAGLTDEDRTAIANMARNFSDVSQAMYGEQEAYYTDLASRYGYNPENVVRLGGPRAKGGKQKSDNDPLGIR